MPRERNYIGFWYSSGTAHFSNQSSLVGCLQRTERARLPRPVRVGIEATGSMKWFLKLMEDLGIDCQVGHPATIRAGAGTVSLLRSLRVAIIGCSSTGSIVVEQLARLGVGEFVLVDPDIVEAKNLNRILNATAEDVERKTPKVMVANRTVNSLGRGQTVLPLQMNVDSVEAVHRVAECDVIFGCVDTAEGRNLANRIASYYVIPFIDVGVRLVADGRGSVESIAGAVNYYKPGGSTLLERGAISSEQDYSRAKVELERCAQTADLPYIRQSKVWKWLELTCRHLGQKEEADHYAQLARPS
jgi:hypothetical protein